MFLHNFEQELKASELLKDPERLKHIPHQLSSPEKDKQRESKDCNNFVVTLHICSLRPLAL